jgi:hypothetical protein
MEKTFTKQDIEQIEKRGMSINKIEQQLHFFQTGIPKINLQKAATINDGIFKFTDEQTTTFCNYFDKHKNKYDIQKFVPASGAATRMFKALSEFLTQFNLQTDTINSYVNKYNATEISLFVVGIRNFPFYNELKAKTKQLFPDYNQYNSDQKVHSIISTLLSENGLNYASKPKGILPFHVEKENTLTPIDEHIFETEFYVNDNKKTKIHFTISKEFENDFLKITNKYPNLDVTFSYQENCTDTIAVNADNTPFREENNQLFFRPGGHGALIENLNNLQSDVVFIKNIDNVSLNNRELNIKTKKLIGGVLLFSKRQAELFLKKLVNESISSSEINEIIDFIQVQMSYPLPTEFKMFKQDFQVEYLIKTLNRPIRVCGMVKNEGEPGGGPFWVLDNKNRPNLQIIESSQIDLQNQNQKEIFENSTHFNPVDIVCSLKDFKGDKFNLLDFVDQQTAFITEKTKNGKPIKAFELPGLWNGAMAKWITVFIEVPLETFNPVKSVNDLLKPAHQSVAE